MSLCPPVCADGTLEAANPLTTVLLFQGHLFDSGLINHILDSLENATVGTFYRSMCTVCLRGRFGSTCLQISVGLHATHHPSTSRCVAECLHGPVCTPGFNILHWDIGPNQRSGRKQTSSAVIQVRTESQHQQQALLTDLHRLINMTPSAQVWLGVSACSLSVISNQIDRCVVRTSPMALQASLQQLPFTGATTGAAYTNTFSDAATATANATAAAAPTAPPPTSAPAATTPSSDPPASPATQYNNLGKSIPPAQLHVSSGPSARRVLVLGSGFVSGPVVEYLTDPAVKRSRDNFVTVGSLDLPQAQKLCANNAAARPISFNASDQAALEAAVKNSDLVISMLPATAHLPVARACIEFKKNMVTASYISPDMRKLHVAAARAGVTILNEVGLDPGIDHMSAMSIIDKVKDMGGRVLTFESMCGGLPAPEAADNPLGYKFSWSPRGVLLAAQNAAVFRKAGKTVSIEGADLLRSAAPVSIMPALNLEHLPNRNSLQYEKVYGLDGGAEVCQARHCTWFTRLWIFPFGVLIDVQMVW